MWIRPLDFDPDDLEIEEEARVWPARKNVPHPDALEGAHLCRAFDGLTPADVRVVVLGQDPYPKIGQATGRAFEDGTWNNDFGHLAESLRPIVRSALALAWDEPALHGDAWNWNELCAGRLDDDAARAAMSGFFDSLAGPGRPVRERRLDPDQTGRTWAHRTCGVP